jgi:hypothetical protein
MSIRTSLSNKLSNMTENNEITNDNKINENYPESVILESPEKFIELVSGSIPGSGSISLDEQVKVIYYVYIHIHIYVYELFSNGLQSYISCYLYICIYICVYVSIYVYTYVYIYVYIYTYMYI